MEALSIDMRSVSPWQATKLLIIDPRSDPLWNRLTDHHRSSVFHSPSWIRVITETYAWDARAFVLLDASGEPLAGIPFCRVSDIMSPRIVILPFSDYCDPLTKDAEQWNYLAERLFAEEGPFVLHCLYSCPPADGTRWEIVKQARWHGIDLQPDLETVWRRFDHVAQGNIRKAQREGVVVHIAEREEELRAFFDMHLRVRKYKHHLLAQPFRLFEKLWREILQPGGGMVMLATRQEAVIAGGLFLEWKDTLYYKFNTSVPEDLCYRPNDLLIWEAIQYAKSKGYVELDFGRTDWDHVELARYKRKFGAHEKTITLYRYGGTPVPSQQDQRIRLLLPRLTELFTEPRVPDDVTEQAGDIMYSFFV
jgi:CelD/BcsL family acetyltransferase involved in cellulose biosynthesis